MKIVIIASILSFAVGVKLPPNFQKCNRKQADFKTCVLKAAQDGLSQLTKPYDELKIPSINPFELAEASLTGGTGPVAVDQKFTNCKIYGLTDVKMEDFGFDFDKKTMHMSDSFPEIKFLCDYEMKGQVLVIPVNGKGNSTIILKNLKSSILLSYEEIHKKGKTHMKFISSELTMDPELVTYNFENHGDRSLTDRLNPVLNDNWKEIFDEVKEGYGEIFKQVFQNLLNQFFGKVSMEEAFDD